MNENENMNIQPTDEQPAVLNSNNNDIVKDTQAYLEALRIIEKEKSDAEAAQKKKKRIKKLIIFFCVIILILA